MPELQNVVVADAYGQLPGGWHPSEMWDMGEEDHRVIVAESGDQTAFIVAKEEPTATGSQWRLLGAARVGGLANATVDHNCEVAGVDEPDVFAEMQVGYSCSQQQNPAARAWRSFPDGSICTLPADHVSCGETNCD